MSWRYLTLNSLNLSNPIPSYLAQDQKSPNRWNSPAWGKYVDELNARMLTHIHYNKTWHTSVTQTDRRNSTKQDSLLHAQCRGNAFLLIFITTYDVQRIWDTYDYAIYKENTKTWDTCNWLLTFLILRGSNVTMYLCIGTEVWLMYTKIHST